MGLSVEGVPQHLLVPHTAEGLNFHAEQIAIAKARHANLDRIFSMAIWGQQQADQQSGRQHLTLHPCGLSRDLMTLAPEITPQTLLLSANTDFSVCEVASLPELERNHDPNFVPQ